MSRTLYKTMRPAIVTILAGAVSVLLAQAPPAFDVASVKVADGPTIGIGLQRSGGRITWTATRATLVGYAFQVPYYRIMGLGAERLWIAIQAETDPSASEAQIRLMLQKLLADRLQLVVHRETKDRQVFALTVAKGGPKMKLVKPDEAVSPLPKGILRGMTPPDGQMVGFVLNNHPSYIARRVTMQQVADALFTDTETIVLDKTGLPGAFDFELNFVSDTSPTLNGDAPSLFMALQEQLGLKLEKQIAPVEMLVVDRMEKTPTAN